MKNVLITGDKGFIGQHLRKYLEDQGHKVFGLDLKDDKVLNDLSRYYDDYEKLKIDLIVHCAAFCRIRECIEKGYTNFLTNTEGVFQILDFARINNIKKVILFSSSRVLSEDKNPYTASKIYGEELAKAYKQCYGIDYIIIRPSTVFGELDSNDRIVPKFINNALNHKDLEIYGNKDKTLDLTYIKEFMYVFNLIWQQDIWNQEFNIGNSNEVNIERLAEFIIKQTNSSSKIIFKDQEKAQPQRVKIDNSLIRFLGYKPKHNWKENIKKTIRWIENERTSN